MIVVMVSRAESAAATRRALLDAAGELLDEGGVDMVTLREVGARAGVSRGAPYRHFADKASLLSAVAAEGWQRLGHRIHALRSDPVLPDADKLHGALRATVELGRDQPHLHQMMCSPLLNDPTPVLEAAEHYRDEFLAIVATLVGEQKAGHYGALLLASAYGTADMERSGHLAADTWNTTAENLLATLVAMIVTISRTR